MEKARVKSNAIIVSIIVVSVILLFGYSLFIPSSAHAATPQVGTYTLKSYTKKALPSSWGSTKYRGKVTVKILSYNRKTKKVRLKFEKENCYLGDILTSQVKTVKVKKNRCSFSFKYGYGYQGRSAKAKATVMFGKKYVKVKFKTTRYADIRHGFDTDGYVKIKRGVHKKYFD